MPTERELVKRLVRRRWKDVIPSPVVERYGADAEIYGFPVSMRDLASPPMVEELRPVAVRAAVDQVYAENIEFELFDRLQLEELPWFQDFIIWDVEDGFQVGIVAKPLLAKRYPTARRVDWEPTGLAVPKETAEQVVEDWGLITHALSIAERNARGLIESESFWTRVKEVQQPPTMRQDWRPRQPRE